MTVEEMLDDIEQQRPYFAPGIEMPDRFVMLEWMSAELNALSGKIPNADCFYRFVTPMIQTETGVREYSLPDDFPENFARHAGQRFYQSLMMGGDKHACILNDGTKDALMSYCSPVQFYSKNLDGQANGRPSEYTITTSPEGRKNLLLSPPPDSNSSAHYTIGGLYQPTDWKLTEETALPPIPHNCAILRAAVKMRINPNMRPEYDEAFSWLMMSLARSKPAQFVPVLGRSGLNEYTLSRRRI